MHKLFERDWRFILSAIYSINSTETIEQLRRESLNCIHALIPCTQVIFYLTKELESGRIQYYGPVVVGENPLYFDEFAEKYTEDPYFNGMGINKQTETFRDTDIMPEEYRVNTDIYKNIYKKQGIHYGLRSFLVHDMQTIACITLFNSIDMRDFPDRDVAVLELLAPHIALKLGRLKATSTKIGLSWDAQKEALLHKYALTNREYEILVQIANGDDDSEVAKRLFISMSTFRKHVYNAYRKLNVNNRVQLYTLLNSLDTDESSIEEG